MNMLTRPWTHMFDYRGRSTRREYWLFVLTGYLGLFALALLLTLIAAIFYPLEELASATPPTSPGLDALAIVVGIVLTTYMIAWFLASLSVSVRRLHDHDKSGWLLLITLFPLVGWIFSLIMMLTPGNDYENSYGPDPRQGEPLDNTAQIFA